MPAHSAAFLMPSSFEDEDSFSDGTSREVVGGLTAQSRVVLGQKLRRLPLKKFGLAMLVLATVGAACAFARGSLTRKGAPGRAGAATALHEKKGSKHKHGKKKCGKSFDKCGGSDFTGASCCQRGCACIEQSQYFSMCKAPAGLDECDLDKAGLMADKLRKKAVPLRKRAEKKAALYKKKQARADKLQTAFVEARAVAMQALQKAQVVKAKLDKQNQTYLSAVKKSHQIGWERDQAVLWWTTVNNEHNADCGDWNGKCQESKCCQHGCGCIWKNAYYSQCGPPKGQSSCSVAIAEASAKEHAIKATGNDKKTSLEDAKQSAEDAKAEVVNGKKALDNLVVEHDKLHKEYTKCHGDRVQAQKLRDSSKKAADYAKKRAKQVKKKIGKAQIAADVWEEAVREPVTV